MRNRPVSLKPGPVWAKSDPPQASLDPSQASLGPPLELSPFPSKQAQFGPNRTPQAGLDLYYASPVGTSTTQAQLGPVLRKPSWGLSLNWLCLAIGPPKSDVSDPPSQ